MEFIPSRYRQLYGPECLAYLSRTSCSIVQRSRTDPEIGYPKPLKEGGGGGEKEEEEEEAEEEETNINIESQYC